MARQRLKSKTRIFIVDDHPVVRYGLARFIDQQSDLVVCGEAGDAKEALDAICATKPDLAIIALSLRGIDDMELIKGLKERREKLPLLVFSMHDEFLFAERAIRAGARGYIMKHEPLDHILAAIHRVLNGEIYMSERMVAKILQQISEQRSAAIVRSPLETLSDRELQIFKLIGKGHSPRDIAKELYVSVKTVESHYAHIKEKLGLKNTTELMHHAIKWVDSGGDI